MEAGFAPSAATIPLAGGSASERRPSVDGVVSNDYQARTAVCSSDWEESMAMKVNQREMRGEKNNKILIFVFF